MNLNPKGTGNLDQSALLQQMAELQTQLDSYKSELADLRQQVSGTRRDSQIVAVTSEVTSRRKMMRRLGLGAGVVTLGALSATSAMAAYNANDNAVDTTAGANGYGLNVNAAGLAHVRLVPPTAAGGPPAIGTDHQVGEVYAAGNGSLYYASGTGAAATPKWTALATATSSGPATFSKIRYTVPAPSNSAASPVNVRTLQASFSGATGVFGVVTVFAPSGNFSGTEFLTAGPGAAPANGSNVTAAIAYAGSSRFSGFVMVALDATGIMNLKYFGTATPAANGIVFDIAGIFN